MLRERVNGNYTSISYIIIVIIIIIIIVIIIIPVYRAHDFSVLLKAFFC